MRLVSTLALFALVAVLILAGLSVELEPTPEPVAPDAQQKHEDIISKIMANEGLL